MKTVLKEILFINNIIIINLKRLNITLNLKI